MPLVQRLLYVAICCAAFVGTSLAQVQQPQVQQPQVINREYLIKAGYFAYFGGYIRWPSDPFDGSDKEFVIGVLGSNPFRQFLPKVGGSFAIDAGRIKANTIQGKKIKVVEYRSVAEFQTNYQPCHILFISRSAAAGVNGETTLNRVNAALQKTKGQPVLLVADAVTMNESRSLADLGVMICYWNDAQTRQVRMFINRTAQKRERLSTSARLLGLRLVTVL